MVSTFRKACETFGLRKFGFTMVAHNRIPQARGMGSSAEAIVAGIAAAAGFAHRGELNRAAIFDLAAHIEGHPDNVAPAVYGGLTVSYDFETPEGVGSVAISGSEPLRRGFHAVNYPVDPAINAFVFVPDYELSIEKAREALPATIAHADAVYNISRVGLMPAAMNPSSIGDPNAANALLFAATQDRLHQPYRAPLMPPSTALIAKLRRAGFAAAVSGAGPCVLVLHYGDAVAAIESLAAEELASGHWRMLHLPIDAAGVQIERA